LTTGTFIIKTTVNVSNTKAFAIFLIVYIEDYLTRAKLFVN